MSVHQLCTNVHFRPLLNHYLLNVPEIFQTSNNINNHGWAKISALLKVQASCNIHDAVKPTSSEPRIDLTVDSCWSYCLSTPCECWIRQCKSMLMLQMSSWHSLLASQPRISCDRCAAKCRFLDKDGKTYGTNHPNPETQKPSQTLRF